MNTHSADDMALAAITLQLGTLKILAQKGILQDDEAKDIMNEALKSLGPTHPQRSAILQIFKDLGAS